MFGNRSNFCCFPVAFTVLLAGIWNVIISSASLALLGINYEEIYQKIPMRHWGIFLAHAITTLVFGLSQVVNVVILR